MTPADERIVQLLATWQKSLERHLHYTRLPDEKYWQVQAWPKHERPNRWIVDLASQRLAALQRIVQARLSAGDPSLSEALELMAFLSNLVGAEHLERHIPLAAEPQPAAATAREPKARTRTGRATPAAPAGSGATSDETIVADAVRLLGWGKAWHEIPEAIARMAGRPNAAAVRKVLKAERANIERQAAAAPAQE